MELILIASAFKALLAVQCLHSIEELSMGFHKRWYAVKMPFWIFLFWEICFQAFWFFVLLAPSFPARETWMAFFNYLMFANGVQHVVWAGVEKKYVPGLLTAPLFFIVFFWFYL